MKEKVKYYFSRFIVFLVILHTIDVSIDIDYITVNMPWSHVEGIDDVDSFSEYIIEQIFDNDHLIEERDHDDQRPAHHFVFKSVQQPVYVCDSACFSVSLIPVKVRIDRPAASNTRFSIEDYSCSAFNPPDHSAVI